MEQFVILSKLEQEYLLRSIESSLQVRDARQFFLWTQGQFQAVLPHAVMVCLQFDSHDTLLRHECMHGAVLDAHSTAALCDARSGLAVRIARQWLDGQGGPAMSDMGPTTQRHALAEFQPELEQLGYDNVLAHGTPRTAGGFTCFVLFGLPLRPSVRHAYFLELLLPHLHLALLRLEHRALPLPEGAARPIRPVSAREAEILHWVREGKSNFEIGLILGISALTVKNHLQRIYKTLGVSNRTQAVSRGMALRLFDAHRPLQ